MPTTSDDDRESPDDRGERHLIIVSGLSGSGKSTALATLEDLGYYCVDNLPIALLPAFGEQLLDSGASSYQQAAVGIDARNMSGLEGFAALLDNLRSQGIHCQVLFFTAERQTIARRFNETRRKHPLAGAITLADAIALEQERLSPLADQATRMVDTTQLTIYELRDLIRNLLGEPPRGLTLVFLSFGFKYGAPMDADLVFDMRCLPNPHWRADLRDYTGLQQPVIDFLTGDPQVERMFTSVHDFLAEWLDDYAAGSRGYLMVGIGCTGGRHRSVYMAQRLAHAFRDSGQATLVRHRQLAGAGDSAVTP